MQTLRQFWSWFEHEHRPDLNVRQLVPLSSASLTALRWAMDRVHRREGGTGPIESVLQRHPEAVRDLSLAIREALATMHDRVLEPAVPATPSQRVMHIHGSVEAVGAEPISRHDELTYFMVVTSPSDVAVLAREIFGAAYIHPSVPSALRKQLIDVILPRGRELGAPIYLGPPPKPFAAARACRTSP